MMNPICTSCGRVGMKVNAEASGETFTVYDCRFCGNEGALFVTGNRPIEKKDN